MPKPIVARWATWSGDGTQHLVLREDAATIVAEGVVVSDAAEAAFAVRYRIECDPAWRVRRFVIGVAGEVRQLSMFSDGEGHWTDAKGRALPQFDGSVDVDLAVTPFTNTLPIRRLDLRPGQSADIDPVYVGFPELSVTADPQRYTCLEYRRRYRFESRDIDFVREIETDANGLVTIYPGLFRRTL